MYTMFIAYVNVHWLLLSQGVSKLKCDQINLFLSKGVYEPIVHQLLSVYIVSAAAMQ